MITALPVLVLRYIVNRSCLGVDTDQIGCETALPVLVSRYAVNRACLEDDSDRIDSETASPVLVLGSVGN